ncbi:probable RNA-binding protein 19 [Protopterus annectens]|uniref:probable RNA-binding protein 19 n=1 Tax=Protopterus annectens TaxID=7888 RepID=UPI001CF9C2E6|nr:probable RNA-binding protein 19 [Protopterus annectens]
MPEIFRFFRVRWQRPYLRSVSLMVKLRIVVDWHILILVYSEAVGGYSYLESLRHTMSRLIVKNLPNGMKEDRFRKMFADFGTLTDCSLKYTKDGKFRKFGFVGFQTEAAAQEALKHFHKSFVDTARITVEFCKSLGDLSESRAWSKHSRKMQPEGQKSKKLTQKEQDALVPKSVKSKKNVPTVLKELEEDEKFNEFLAVHKHRTQAPTWANDTLAAEGQKRQQKQRADDYLNFDSDESEDLSEDEESEGSAKEEETDDKETKTNRPRKQVSTALKKDLSDMQYLRSKIVKESKKEEEERSTAESDEDLESSMEDDEKLQRQGVTKSAQTHTDSDYESEEIEGGGGEVKKQGLLSKGKKKMNTPKQDAVNKNQPTTPYTIKLRGAPFNVKEQDVKEFFAPLKLEAIRIIRNKHGNKTGPLSDIHFPIDNLTKKPKGFAFITYMIPEHAVKAYAALDGAVMQGRVMHVMPSTIKKEQPDGNQDVPGSSSYKMQKASKEKANSASTHNWNTLFMGTNAVADAIAQKYSTTKGKVLDHEGKGSVAVRMALGETELVQETRQFLINNGVCLDAFSQAAAERSKMVILVKNLPAGTESGELEKVFSKYGDLGRVVLPPAGITAIVEFLEPTEAKLAFSKLAYSKFHHVPLYLEWAPTGVFISCVEKKEKQRTALPEEGDKDLQESKEENLEEESEEEEETVPGRTLFIKNLNFSTTEESLRETFSKIGKVKSCSISKKKDKTGALLSMGYGFVEYKRPEHMQKAMKLLQHCTVDGHRLELKISERATKSAVAPSRKKQTAKKQTSSKILVRNVPFQATVREIRELFSTFGELKTVRLPKKMSGTGSHRGFAFVDFLTKQDAKKAFTALCHSTHLYGRRLVLEWADSEESVEALRRKTAEHFHETPKKRKKRSDILEEIVEQLDEEEDEN